MYVVICNNGRREWLLNNGKIFYSCRSALHAAIAAPTQYHASVFSLRDLPDVDRREVEDHRARYAASRATPSA